MVHAFLFNGSEHELWLSRAGAGYFLNIDGQRIAVNLQARGEHAHELLFGDDSSAVLIARRGDEVHVHLDGESHVLHYHHSLKRYASQQEQAGETVMRAPMPGSVIAVCVEAGQQVQRGDALMVIESMKMETMLSASCDAVVQGLHADVGQTFDKDALLITLDGSASQ